jgi:sulfite exporter TauE/SafE
MSAVDQLVIAILSGLAAGGIHVFSGPDHLAAIAPLSLHKRARAWVTGARWGIGHASGVLFVGLASLFVREFVAIEAVSSWAERFVGVALVAIGFWGLRKAFSRRVHVHAHSHGGETHVHVHAHEPGHTSAENQDRPHSHTHAAFAVGTLHGVAGSSHILGVLPALAFPAKIQTVSYLFSYGLGTILAMSFFSTAIAFLARRASQGAVAAGRWLMVGCSAFAIGLGTFWLAS